MMKHINLFEEFIEKFDTIKDIPEKGALQIDNNFQLHHLENILSKKGYSEHVIGVKAHTLEDPETIGIIWNPKKEWDRVNFVTDIFEKFTDYFKLKHEYRGHNLKKFGI